MKKQCTHPAWSVKQTANGLQRKCRGCGLKITEVASGVFGKMSILGRQDEVKSNKKSKK